MSCEQVVLPKKSTDPITSRVYLYVTQHSLSVLLLNNVIVQNKPAVLYYTLKRSLFYLLPIGYRLSFNAKNFEGSLLNILKSHRVSGCNLLNRIFCVSPINLSISAKANL